jgi:GNAT superfamily N-acetyltransferase
VAGARTLSLFAAGPLEARELAEAELPELQALFESNPGYFEIADGEPVGPDAARKTFERRPPDDMAYQRIWRLGVRDGAGTLVVMADVIEDLIAPRVWHVGFFMVAGGVHGRGVGRAVYEALESWMGARGAQWLRLGVVEGNVRAEHFWRARGYSEVRRRYGVEMGRKVNTLLVMMKPLGGGALDEYLALVERDRPDWPLTPA